MGSFVWGLEVCSESYVGAVGCCECIVSLTGAREGWYSSRVIYNCAERWSSEIEYDLEFWTSARYIEGDIPEPARCHHH